MNAAPATDAHAQEPAPRDPRRAPLLGLVRKLIAYGRDIVATLQGRNAPAPPAAIARNFGSLNLALIIARITRGLMIAAALETRLLRALPPPAEARPRATPTAPRAKPEPKHPPADEEAELFADLPSAREIAARMRNRPPGAVIVEICRDLGIDGTHPLWRDVCHAIICGGGSMVTMLRVMHRRLARVVQAHLPPDGDPRYAPLLAVGTHPP